MDNDFRIATWNINGIRALPKSIGEILKDLDVDIACFQETKVTRDQLEEKIAIVDGYNSYFDYSNVRNGYSGVATYVKDSAIPIKAQAGLSGSSCDVEPIGPKIDMAEFTCDEIKALDNEGRAVITQHKIRIDQKDTLLTVINVYCPRADPEREDRKQFKLQFYRLLKLRAESILQSGSHVIVLGDVNTAHQRIDSCDPGDEKEFQKHEGRKWISSFLYQSCSDGELNESNQMIYSNVDYGYFIDTFRYLHPDTKEAYTCWRTDTGARKLNYGSRIDYVFADKELCVKSLHNCSILSTYLGSDHCPVLASFSCSIISSQKCPSICSKNMPEFYGKQQKLSQFLVKKENNDQMNQALADRYTSNFEIKSDKSCSSKRSASNTHDKRTNFHQSNKKQKTLNNFFTCSQKSKAISSLHFKEKSIEKFDIIVSDISNINSANINGSAISQWKQLLKGPAPLPSCKGHNLPCALRTVKKDSLNKDRQFYCCDQPDGPKDNPLSRCDHFVWVTKNKK